MNKTVWSFLALVLLAVATRFVPHPPNFSPLGGLALFSGAVLLNKRFAVIVPLLAMLLSDVFLGLHNTMIFVYGSFALIAFVGFRLQGKWRAWSIFASSLSASLVFFLITNFGVWLMTPMYAKTAAGLATCFLAAIPFFHQTVLGDLLYTTALFGGYVLLTAERKSFSINPA